MKLMYFILLIIAGCSKVSSEQPVKDQGFNAKMNRVAYMGKTSSKLYLGGYDPLPSVEGTGSFNVDKINGDSSTLALVADLSGDEGFTFAIPGKQDGITWNSKFPNASFLIKSNGEIDAKMIASGKEITWDGRLFDDKLILDIKIKYLESENGIAVGSILNTHLDLVNQTAGNPNNNDNSCKAIVWQSRPIFNIYSGGIDLMSVPVCH